jgi:hypothetical protein
MCITYVTCVVPSQCFVYSYLKVSRYVIIKTNSAFIFAGWTDNILITYIIINNVSFRSEFTCSHVIRLFLDV